MYNLNYAPTTLGVQSEEKLYVGVREQKRLNTAGLEDLNARHHLLVPEVQSAIIFKWNGLKKLKIVSDSGFM